MNRIIALLVLAALSLNARALDVVGVKVPEKIQSGGQPLVLNGAGSRFMAGVFHVYVIGLYLPETRHSVAEILAEEKNRNVTIWFLAPLGVKATSEQLLDATSKLMSENMDADRLKKLDASWKQFAAMFASVKDFQNGDQLSVDYQPGKGMRVSMNGKELGSVAEADFMRAFLLVWLGERPAQVDLKDKLLGLPANAK